MTNGWKNTSTNVKLIELLLRYEAVDVDVRTSEGETPLMFAATLNLWSNLDLVKCLVAAGADVAAVDQDGA